MIDLVFRTTLRIFEIKQNQARTSSVKPLPRTNDGLMACKHDHTHLIVFKHVCGYYSRAATIRGQLLFLWRSSRCGYFSG